jgi:hypothetical protein
MAQLIAAWIADDRWYPFFAAARALFLFLDALLVVVIVFAFLKCLEYRPRLVGNPRAAKRARPLRDPETESRWTALLAKADKNPPHSFVLAIIEADKIADDALKRLGFQGDHMADRLEKLNATSMKTLEGLWRVHRLRNELVHAPDFEVSETDAREVLGTYQKFLKELGVIG